MVQAVALLLDRAADDAATGAAERYSRTDMWDLAARARCRQRRPADVPRRAVGEADPDLAARIDDESAAQAVDALKPYRTAGGWASYDEVTEEQRAELAERFRAFADALAEVPGALDLT